MEEECLAVVRGLLTLRPYFFRENCVVHTDHSLLRWLINITDLSVRLTRSRLRISEFYFQVVYKKGKKNKANVLSRLKTLSETIEDIEYNIPCFLIKYNLSQSTLIISSLSNKNI